MAKISTLVESFSSANPATFTGYGSNAVVTNNELRLFSTSNYSTDVRSSATYDLAASQVAVQITRLSTTDGDQLQIRAYGSTANCSVVVQNTTGTANCDFVVAVNDEQVYAANFLVNSWIRLRESGGTLYVETSTDGTNYTVHASTTTTILDRAYGFLAGNYKGITTSTTPWAVDNVNNLTQTIQAAASLGGNSNLTAAAFRALPGASSMSGNSNMTASASGEVTGAAALSGNSNLVAAGSLEVFANAGLSGNSNLMVTTSGETLAAADLSGSSGLTVFTDRETITTVDLSGTAALTAAADVVSTGTEILAEAALYASGSLYAEAMVQVPILLTLEPLSGTSGLDVTAQQEALLEVALSGTTGLIAFLASEIKASVALSATSLFDPGELLLSTKTYVLTTPTRMIYPLMRGQRGRYFGIPVGVSLVREGGFWRQEVDPDLSEGDLVLQGGRRHVLTKELHAELTTAGYAEFLTIEPPVSPVFIPPAMIEPQIHGLGSSKLGTAPLGGSA